MTVEEQLPILPAIVLGDEPPKARKFLLDVDAKDYHADMSAVSQGKLSLFASHTPAHFHHAWAAPATDATDDMRLGTLLHMAILEPDKYAAGIVRPHFGDGRTKEVKAQKAEWLKGCPPGSLIIEQDDKDRVEGMASNILAHPTARALLADAMREVTVYWADDETRVLCRGRIDLISVADILGDLKTTSCAGAEDHARSIARFMYHFQAAHYLAAANAVARARRYRDFVHVVVERDPPYEVAIYALEERAIEKGEAQRRTALARLRECLDSKKWPGYGDAVTQIDLPPWEYARGHTQATPVLGDAW